MSEPVRDLVSGLVFRPIEPGELDAYRACMGDAFGFDAADDPDGHARLTALLDPARTSCAFDGGRIVATCGTYPFTLSVPGGSIAMAGLTQVTVRPTHRRRGILRRLIGAHLAGAAAHGEPLSGLWASDALIYGRFGYGVAAEAEEMTVTPDAGFDRAPAGGFDAVAGLDDDAAAAELPAIYDRVAAVRPGMFSRVPAWWRWRRFADRADQRRGRSSRRHVVCRRGGAGTGYVVYRQHLEFDPAGRPAGTLFVEELAAVDAAAEATLWQYLAHVDLFPKIEWWNAPTDALATWLAADRRNVHRVRRSDTLWLHVGDVAAALAARRYAADGVVRLAVRPPDGGAPSRFELTVLGGAGRCAALDSDTADLELDLAALGAIYLGAHPPSLVARTGAIRGSAATLAHADRMFLWPAAAPWCAEVF